MSQIKLFVSFASICALAVLIAACGDYRESNEINAASGKHPEGWVLGSHKTMAQQDVEACKECHGSKLDSGISSLSCMSAQSVDGFKCHATSPDTNISGCISCHGNGTTGPYGSVAPNRKFAHTKHVLLAACDICHSGGGYGSANHGKASASGGYSRAAVLMPDSVKSNSPAQFLYDPSTETCSGVSCHGGKTTPVWSTGTITLVAGNNAQCLSCHEQGTQYGSPQFNSYYSGSSDSGANLHEYHLSKGYSCTDCHAVGTLNDYSKHYSGISTKSLVSPAATVGGASTKIGAYSQSSKSCSNVTCHSFSFDVNWVNN